MHLIDYIIVALYAALVLVLGFVRRVPKGAGAAEVIVGGRILTLPAFVGTLVSAWYGGVLGVGEYSYRYGISNWLVLGVPYYVAAFIFAIFLAKKARETELLTIPDRLGQVYDNKTALAGTFILVLMTPPAAYVLIIGVLCQILFGWPIWVGVLCGTFVSVVYVYRGGFNSVVRTDIFEFVLMYAGFAALMIILFGTYGGFGWLKEHLPPVSLTWHGGKSGWYIASWYVIALTTLAEPIFYQRCYAVKNVRTARTGILISIVCWALFDFMTTFSGLYAKAILPDMADPVASYPALAIKILPAGILGLFVVAMYATVMSTVNAYALIAASTFGNDLVPRLFKNKHDIARYTRIGLILTTAIAVVFAIYFQSVIEIWYAYGTVGAPALLVPVVSTFIGKRRFPPKYAFASIVISGSLALIWYLSGRLTGNDYWFGVEPIYPGLACSLLMYALFAKKRPDPVATSTPSTYIGSV
jgi:SSS family solute:Na+ symporter